MASKTVTHDAVAGATSIQMPVGKYGTLQVSAGSTYGDRQDLASCLLSAVVDIAQEQFQDEDKNARGWAIAYLAAVAKGLLDSMTFSGAQA